MYSKRLPALESDAKRLSAISQSMVQATVPEGGVPSSAPAGASSGASSGAPSLAELTTQAAEAVALCERLSAAAGSAGGHSGESKPAGAGRGKARQSFGGVMSQFERDVKTLGGGKRTA